MVRVKKRLRRLAYGAVAAWQGDDAPASFHAWGQARALEKTVAPMRPSNPRYRIVFTGLTRGGFLCQGKVSNMQFYPLLAAPLAAQGIEMHFACTEGAMKRLTDDRPSAVVHIYNEDALAKQGVTFERPYDLAPHVVELNTQATARLMSHKGRFSRFLEERGILTPARIETPRAGERVFSNAIVGSKEGAHLVGADSDPMPFDPERHNTAFIDTRFTYRGEDYYTSIRMMSVGGTMLHAGCRASRVTKGNPSVTASDTPVDPDFINALQEAIVVPHTAALRDLAFRITDGLDLGVFAHDVLVCRETGQLYVTESGFKMDDHSFRKHLIGIKDQIPSLRLIFDDAAPQNLADALMKELGLEKRG